MFRLLLRFFKMARSNNSASKVSLLASTIKFPYLRNLFQRETFFKCAPICLWKCTLDCFFKCFCSGWIIRSSLKVWYLLLILKLMMMWVNCTASLFFYVCDGVKVLEFKNMTSFPMFIDAKFWLLEIFLAKAKNNYSLEFCLMVIRNCIVCSSNSCIFVSLRLQQNLHSVV